jgi:hypothetical protein
MRRLRERVDPIGSVRVRTSHCLGIKTKSRGEYRFECICIYLACAHFIDKKLDCLGEMWNPLPGSRPVDDLVGCHGPADASKGEGVEGESPVASDQGGPRRRLLYDLARTFLRCIMICLQCGHRRAGGFALVMAAQKTMVRIYRAWQGMAGQGRLLPCELWLHASPPSLSLSR